LNDSVNAGKQKEDNAFRSFDLNVIDHIQSCNVKKQVIVAFPL